MSSAEIDRPVTYRDVLGRREFRALYLGMLTSSLGDQMAKLALAILVFDRSDSPALAALAYAVTYLPWLVGGPVLSPVADRFPRRAVLLWCDVGRAVLVGAMVLPGLDLPVLFALLLSASLLTPPFEAARAATLPEALPGDAYVVGSSLSNLTQQLVQVAGFAAGGSLISVMGPRWTLGLNAATFLVSALLIRVGVAARPAARGDTRPTLARDAIEGARVVFGDPVLRSVLLLAWVGAAFTIVPEGLAVVYADSLGGGDVMTGLLTASLPLGVVVGAVVIGRTVRPAARLRLIVPLAVLALVPLLFTVFHPPAWLAGTLWAVSGFGMAYQLPANAAFVASVDPSVRGRAFGLAQSGLQLSQGLAIALGGWAAQTVAVELVIAAAGLLGLVVVVVLGATWPYAAVAEAGARGAVPAGGEARAVPADAVVAAAAQGAVVAWTGPYQLRPARRELVARLQPPD
jgi:MFS family permease